MTMDKLWQQTYFSRENPACQTFVYNERIIRGVIQKNEADALDYLNDVKPRTSAVVWFPANAVPLNNPFRKGQFFTSGQFRFQIESVIAPCGVPAFWSVTALVDRMKPQTEPEPEPEESEDAGD